jgi:hypothetical protein
MRNLAIAAVLAGLALPAASPLAAFERITDAREFTQTVAGRDLTRFGIRLQVTPDGGIRGRGFGYTVTGEWRWESGFFCRDMDWGGTDIGYNCQAVLRDGNRVRFIADQGRGEHADFTLR